MPTPPPHPESLPDTLTFFLTRAQRRAILQHLSTTASNRTQALLRALNLQPNSLPSTPPPPSRPSRSSR